MLNVRLKTFLCSINFVYKKQEQIANCLLLGRFKVYPWFCVCRKFSSSFLFEVFRYFVLKVQFELSFFCGGFQKLISLKFVSQQIITVCPTIKTDDMLPVCLHSSIDIFFVILLCLNFLYWLKGSLFCIWTGFCFENSCETSRDASSAKEIASKTALSAKIKENVNLNSSLIWYHC